MGNEPTDSEPRGHIAPPAAEPRLAPLRVEEITDEMRGFLLHMLQLGAVLPGIDDRKVAANYAPTASDLEQGDLAPLLANMPEITATMLHHPRLFTLLTNVGIQLMRDGALSPRERELAILRIAWLCQAAYEWGEGQPHQRGHRARHPGFTSARLERA